MSRVTTAHTNRLAQETSPYLLQHQHNPVDWYAWGPEAFERARREDRPIFLSVGYSTCYWCHVMERQSFESEAVAAVMNEKFVNIKVDREERPDVDQLYMTAVQVLTRQGGWPMSVWLTPELKPFYGGTYFPPTDQYGRPGFVTLLNALEDAYRSRREQVEQTAEQITGILRQAAEPEQSATPIRIDEAFVDDLIGRSVSDYDPVHGGFGAAPKFPRETVLELLLVYLRGGSEISDLRSQIRRRLLHTLDALAAGGIRDHLGGGFHRYSTDAKWLVPHFEIMLYDNAMLAWCYTEAFRQTRETRYADVARGVFDFVLREMTSPQGAFYTALDAEVDGQEGLNYLWTAGEVESILGADDAKVFNGAYGLDLGPNFADPHHGSGVPDKSILFLPKPLDDAMNARLEPMRRKLKSARDQRKQPLLDTKILTSWNALMIRALAHGGHVLDRADYLEAARRGAEFLLSNHRTSAGGLLRTSRDGRAKYDGFLDDYAYLVHAMLALSEAGLGEDWRQRAGELAQTMIDRFGDEGAAPGSGGLYFTDRGSSDLIVRQKTASDSPLPSGNGIAAQSLLSLGNTDAASEIVSAFAQHIEQNGEGMSAMVQAALLLLRAAGPFETSAAPETPKSSRPAPPQKQAQDVVEIGGDWASRTELRLRLRIAKGFHINANQLDNAEIPLVPTRVSIESPAEVQAKIDYPPGETFDAPFASTPLSIYKGDTTIVIRFEKPVTSDLRLGISYQPCDDTACLPPVTKRIVIPAP